MEVGVAGDIDRAVEIIEAIRLYARPEILKWYRPDSCIASSRVVFDLLRHYEMRPLAMACHVRILNAALLKRIEKEGRHPKDEAEIRKWSRGDGSWNIGLGGTGQVRPNRWDGHLVVLAYGGVMIDVSIDQANRPRKNIALKPIVMTVDPSWGTGEADAPTMENGCLLVYRAIPGDRDWVRTTGWSGHKDVRETICRHVIEKVERHLAD
jgi:hypothetical protein